MEDVLREIRDDIALIKKLLSVKKGSNCSKSGNNYEKLVYDIIKDRPHIKCLCGGSSHNPDIECVDGKSIEVKKESAPDWGQSVLKWEDGKWVSQNELFQKYMGSLKMKRPPFFDRKMKYSEWLEIKSDFKDEYVDIDDETISIYYKSKGTDYIQVSGYGLYHMGDDVFNLGVPKLNIKQRMRVRVKVHTSSDKNGYAHLSVTAAFQPMSLKDMKKSMYSLDDVNRLPPNL